MIIMIYFSIDIVQGLQYTKFDYTLN